MTQYEHSLIAMKRLLDTVAALPWAEPVYSRWSQWISTDIEQWRSNGDTSHHLKAYAGNGSLNDFGIGSSGEHSEFPEAWANTLFESLRNICYFLARHPTERFTAETLANHVGYNHSALAAFVGGDQVPKAMPDHANEHCVLRGWRCLYCGRSEVAKGAIESFMAVDLIPNRVLTSCASFTLDRLVDQILSLDIPGLDTTRETLAAAAIASDIRFVSNGVWNWLCPHCNSDQTAAYRWNLIRDDECRFEPSPDNLPLRE